MRNKQSFSVTNRREVRDALKGLSDRLKNRVMRSAISEALTPFVRAARAAAKTFKRTGLLAKSMGKTVRTYSSGVTFGAAGPDKNTIGRLRGKNVIPGKYAHLPEYGTKAHNQPKRKAMHPGSKGRAYMQKSWRAVKGQVLAVIVNKVKTALDREAAKLSGKGKK